MNAVSMNPTIGNIIFSLWLTTLGGAILMSLSFFVVNKSIIGS